MSGSSTPEGITELFEITPDGAYIDGHKILAADEITVEHAADDLHIITLKLYAKNFHAVDHHQVNKTSAAVYHYAHDETSKP